METSTREEQEFAAAIFDEIKVVRERGGRPLVVLDIDLTLMDNRERTRQILVDYLNQSGRSGGELETALEAVRSRDIIYSIQENMAAIGVEGDEFRSKGLPFWMECFFADEYCQYDSPYADAARACQALHEAGGVLVYLTGRYADTQSVGTVASLREHGFPIAVLGTMLIMKTERSESDMDYKRRVAKELGAMGQAVAGVDNEPGHCNTMKAFLPSAKIAHMDTLYGGRGGPLNEGISILKHWSAFTRPRLSPPKE